MSDSESTQLFTLKSMNPGCGPPNLVQLQQYAKRLPMAQLPDQYRVTKSNPDPPLVHFAFPMCSAILYRYAAKHNLTDYLPLCPNAIAPSTVFNATEHLSEHVEYKLSFGWPYEYTADCPCLLELFSNYTIEEKLVDEDEEDVIQMVQEALELDKSVRPKWYFDVYDEWEPDCEDEESD